MESYESMAPKPLTSQYENKATREEAVEKIKRQKVMQRALYPSGKNFCFVDCKFLSQIFYCQYCLAASRC